eukprot:5896481-Ditylum_brightwellii.AAC.1
MPRIGHLKLARKIFGCLKKYSVKGYVINLTPLQLDLIYQQVELKLDFGTQYSYFEEKLDPRHDKVTGRCITGMLSAVGLTPVTWSSKWQAAVQASTFAAEFTALKKMVEEAAAL